MSELILTAVPGIAMPGGGALLRIVVTPRLTVDPAAVADPTEWPLVAQLGLGEWPSLIAAARFDVEVIGPNQVFSAPGIAVRSEGSVDVWRGFFDQVRVRPMIGQRTYSSVAVAPTSSEAQQVHDAYRAVTTEVVTNPAVVPEQLSTLSFAPPPPAPDVSAAVAEFAPPDFHQVLATLREHPTVMRALGLIVELTVPKEAFAQIGSSGEIRVRWAGAPPIFDTVSSPRTAWALDGTRFLAASAGLVRRGMVDLTTTAPLDTVDPVTGAVTTAPAPVWTVRSFDIDGAVSRLEQARAEPGAVMPALRTAGLQLVHRDRQSWFGDRSTRAAGNAGRALDDAPALTAEQLVLGYRLDVRLPGDTWLSTMRRQATYTVNDVPIGPARISEEGHLKPGAVVKGTDEQLRADEVVARWEGHPLALPRVSPDGGTSAAAPDPRMPYRFEWRHEPDTEHDPAPELRYGRRYQLRLRVLDIAGGGLEVGDVPGNVGATDEEFYGRHEPVPPPEMPPPPGLVEASQAEGEPGAYEALLGPAGALDRLVVRSDPAADPATPPIGSYPSNDERTLLPPAARFDVVERHDLLTGDDEQTWRLARRALAAPRGTADTRNTRMYNWVSDPLSHGVSVTAIPAAARIAPSPPNLVVWGGTGDWPDFPHKTVRIVAGAAGTALDVVWTTPSSAIVTLPPGLRATVDLSSFVASPDAPMVAAYEWISSVGTALDAVTDGRHPVITPARRLEVVHAVRRPLGAPTGTLRPDRGAGDTFALLRDPDLPLLGIDRDSTQQVDVVAHWAEWVRGPAGQVQEPRSQVVGTLPVGLDDEQLPPIRHEFGDTLHRAVTYDLSARSRFRDHFDAAEPATAFEQRAQLPLVHVPSSVRPPPLAIASVVPAFAWSLTNLNAPSPEDPFADPFAKDPIVLLLQPLWVLEREGGRLRIEIDGAWFATGDGEQLGLVVEPDPAAAIGPHPDVLQVAIADATAATAHLVTTVYRDPVFPGNLPPAQPNPANVTGTAGAPHVVTDRESGRPVLVLPIDPVQVDGRWFADIGLASIADATYCPQIRLSLARLQPHSLSGPEISLLAKPDLVTLLPTRRLVVDWGTFTPVITLEGTGPTGVANAVEIRLEQAPAGTAPDGLTSLDGGVDGTWEVLDRYTSALNSPFPLLLPPDNGQQRRIVVREFDSIGSSPLPVADRRAQEQSVRTVFVGTMLL